MESILRFGAGVFGRLRNGPELPRSCFRPREGILKCDLDFDAPRNGMKPAQLRTLPAAAFGQARHPIVRGFMVGRSIWGDACRAWLLNEIDDATLVRRCADRYAVLVQAWRQSRQSALQS